MKHSFSIRQTWGIVVLGTTAAVMGAAHAEDELFRNVVTPTVFQAAGPTPASIQSTVDQYRFALGQGDNGNAAGSLETGHREINWDGNGSTATVKAPTPSTVFLDTRGARFTTRGSGFVQAPVDGLVTTFGNASYATIFQPFSRARLFSPIGSNRMSVDFAVPGTDGATPATTIGFGAVFVDVDRPDGSRRRGEEANRRGSTLLEYFDKDGDLLFSSFVPASPGNAGLSFLGIVFADARIARVRIVAGDRPAGADDTARRDIVMLDDFIYGEPRAIE
jgi:hypothetical protein